MKKNYSLTDIEMRIKKLLRSAEKPMTLGEIMNAAVTRYSGKGVESTDVKYLFEGIGKTII